MQLKNKLSSKSFRLFGILDWRNEQKKLAVNSEAERFQIIAFSDVTLPSPRSFTFRWCRNVRVVSIFQFSVQNFSCLYLNTLLWSRRKSHSKSTPALEPIFKSYRNIALLLSEHSIQPNAQLKYFLSSVLSMFWICLILRKWNQSV